MGSRSRIPPILSLLALLLWGALTAAFVARHAGEAADDLFITYRYAQNLADGRGFVFNPGERIFGLTNPGVGLLLALLHRLTGLPIPRLGTAVTGLALLALALLLLLEGRRRGRAPEAWIGGTLVLVSAYLWVCQGGAGPLVLSLLVAAALLVERLPWLAGLLAGLAVWFRPDAGLGVGLLGVMRWIEDRRLPWRYGLAAAAVLLAGALAAALYFGTVVPITMESKQALAALHGGRRSGLGFWRVALGFWRRFGGPTAGLLAICGTLGWLPWWRAAGRGGRLLVLYAAALLLAYPLLGVPFFIWYTVPVAVALLCGVPHLALAPARRLGGRIIPTMAALALAALLYPYLERSLDAYRQLGWNLHLRTYQRAALWLRDHSRPEDAVTLEEIGVVGFYSRRPVLDIFGLVSPTSLPYVAARKLPGAFLAAPTEYVLHHTGRSWLKGMIRAPWFRRAYREVARFEDERGEAVVLYRRRPGRSLPSPPPL